MKLIFSDIDGTLLNDQHQVTTKTKEAIQKRIAQGDLFIPVSARMPEAIATAADVITKDYPMICYNGALILAKNGEVIESHPLSITDAKQIIQTVQEKYQDVAWNVYAGHQWFSPKMAANLNEEKIVQVESTKASLADLDQLDECHKLLLIGKPEEITALQDQLRAEFPKLSIMKSSPILLEIMNKGIQKGLAVQHLIKHFGVNLNDTWAFGDNFNDEQMLEIVGHSVVMANAPKVLQDKVEQVTLDNNHDGIAAVLNKL